MDKFDLKSLRFIGITFFICILFVCVVMNAYKYIPEDAPKNVKSSELQVDITNDYTNDDGEEEFSEAEESVEVAAENVDEDEEEENYIEELDEPAKIEPFVVIEGDPIEQ